jgi:hypothetical protein
MSPKKPKTTRLEFKIESLDSTRPTSQAVPEVTALAEELQATLQERFPGAKVRLQRAEGLPLGPEIQHIFMSIDWDTVWKGVEQTAASFATAQLLTLLKDRFANLNVKKVNTPTSSAPPKKPRKSGTKSVKAPRRKQARQQSPKKKAPVSKNKKRKQR